MKQPWSESIGLHELSHGPVRRHLVADEAARARIARSLNLDALDMLEADLEVTPWLDGAEVSGRWRASVLQTCGVSLEPLPSEPHGAFTVRVLPPDSPNLPETPTGEVEIDLEADDPPDILEGRAVDLAFHVVEHLALEIDPFPRKPDAVFIQPDEPQELSPFAVLRQFKPRGDDG